MTTAISQTSEHKILARHLNCFSRQAAVASDADLTKLYVMTVSSSKDARKTFPRSATNKMQVVYILYLKAHVHLKVQLLENTMQLVNLEPHAVPDSFHCWWSF